MLIVISSFIVDSADPSSDNLPQAKTELHSLIKNTSLDGIPLLVLGNKSDLPEAIGVDELIKQLDLNDISRREVSCYSISAKEETNLDAVVQWLINKAKR